MEQDHITVLGGGPAGLAAAYFANKRGLRVSLYEAKGRIGGNAITFRHGDFLFDSGAHRFHDKDPEITREVKSLLGDELVEINVPSHIYHRGRLIEFPLSPRSLMKGLSLPTLVRVAAELAAGRLRPSRRRENFEEATIHMYGPTVAGQFLLNYSRKVWGIPCRELSADISGGRLRELSALVLLRDMLFGTAPSAAHFEGKFYYPKRGYGEIVEALAGACPEGTIHTDSPVRTIHHHDGRIEDIVIGQGGPIRVGQVVNTIPLPLLLTILDPPPPADVLSVARSLRFRNLVLVALFLDQDRVTEGASLYFPDEGFPFTRLYEPIRRSRLMAPEGKTSLCAEYPCFSTDRIWSARDEELIRSTTSHVQRLGLTNAERVIDAQVIRLAHAYPVLEAGIERRIDRLLEYLGRFSNLRTIGRNGRFAYTSLHHMLRFGLDVIHETSRRRAWQTGIQASDS